MPDLKSFLRAQAEIAERCADRRFFERFGFQRDRNYRRKPKQPTFDDLDEGLLADYPDELLAARCHRDLRYVDEWRAMLPAEHPNQAHFTAIAAECLATLERLNQR